MAKGWAYAVLAVLLIGLCGCAAPAVLQQQVLPTLVSVTVAQDGSRGMLLQGRYFGDGQGGENSYVVVGATLDAQGGVTVRDTAEWSASRIRLSAPEGVGRGYVFVVVDGQRSNGVPADLP